MKITKQENLFYEKTAVIQGFHLAECKSARLGRVLLVSLELFLFSSRLLRQLEQPHLGEGASSGREVPTIAAISWITFNRK